MKIPSDPAVYQAYRRQFVPLRAGCLWAWPVTCKRAYAAGVLNAKLSRLSLPMMEFNYNDLSSGERGRRSKSQSYFDGFE